MLDAKSEVGGLLFEAAARARWAAVAQEAIDHGLDELAGAIPFLAQGLGDAPDDGLLVRLRRVCRVVDGRMLEGFSPEDAALLSTLLERLLRNLR